MKKITGIFGCGVMLLGMGCTEKQRVPEQPPAVSKAAEAPRYTPPVNLVEADDITSENLYDAAAKLQKGIDLDNRASARLPGK